MMKRAVHFVGFRGDEYNSAVRVMPMPPELLAAKAALEAAGYKVEKV